MMYYSVMRTYTFRSSPLFMLGSVPERLLFPRNLTILIECKRKQRRIKKGKSTMITKEGIDQDLQAMGTKCSALA